MGGVVRDHVPLIERDDGDPVPAQLLDQGGEARGDARLAPLPVPGRVDAHQVLLGRIGEGPHQVSLVDGSGNFASSSFYMEFGFDNIKTELDNLNEQIQALNAGNATSRLNQQASFEADRLAALESDLATVKGLLQAQAAPVSAVAEPVTIAGFLAGNANAMWGLMALAGLVLGIVFSRLKLDRHRE